MTTTCIAITNSKTGKACGAITLDPCNLCKKHMLQELMNSEKQEATKKVSKKLPKEKKVKVKRPLTAYLIFCGEMRSIIKEGNPDMSTTEVTAELGAQWSELKESDQEEHQKYVDRAAEAKAKWEAEQKGETYASGDEVEN